MTEQWISFKTDEIVAAATRPDPYPENWPEIASRVKEAAGWRCEHCGHPHDPETGHTLTVRHLDGNPANCADDNLVALCQRCHLHIQTRYRPGQLLLPNIEAPEWLVNRSAPIAEWDKSWENCSPMLTTTCGRCGRSPASEGEKRWLRACGEQIYFCPKCLDVLLAWKDDKLENER